MGASSFEPGFDMGAAFSWVSVGLAVFTGILQGMVAATTYITESTGQWTFRFRLAIFEHYWWTFVCLLLSCSLAMSATAFASGRGGDPVSVLALSSATFLAVVQYTLPAWQQRHYTRTRWLAWTGDSRTAIKKEYVSLCRDAASWTRLVATNTSALARLQATPSDYYGWRLWHVPGIKYDPTDILMTMPSTISPQSDLEKSPPIIGIFEPIQTSGQSLSFLWGRQQGFTPRVSRAVLSMPLTLLRSTPVTVDGYNGSGLAIAMGILGRNKGLQPWKLVFNFGPAVAGLMESTSTWTPRPAKVLRSFYRHTLNAQYQGLGEDFVNAAVELALLIVDIPNHALDEWLRQGLEHQSIQVNNWIAAEVAGGLEENERNAILTAHYEASYVAMIVSLNSMNPEIKNDSTTPQPRLERPDVICTALLCRVRGVKTSSWWSRGDVQNRVSQEKACLRDGSGCRTAAAKLLGLDDWPHDWDLHDTVERKSRTTSREEAD